MRTIASRSCSLAGRIKATPFLTADAARIGSAA
jgi:hypothetical protein